MICYLSSKLHKYMYTRSQCIYHVQLCDDGHLWQKSLNINFINWHTGLSCESCAPGYEREGGRADDPMGRCVPSRRSDCNQLGTAREENGRCVCKPFTTGQYCDRCVGMCHLRVVYDIVYHFPFVWNFANLMNCMYQSDMWYAITAIR